MTREEAYVTASMGYMGREAVLVNEQIDKIYDDFESRTCENCISWRTSEAIFDICLISDSDFGCNKFERKDIA